MDQKHRYLRKTIYTKTISIQKEIIEKYIWANQRERQQLEHSKNQTDVSYDNQSVINYCNYLFKERIFLLLILPEPFIRVLTCRKQSWTLIQHIVCRLIMHRLTSLLILCFVMPNTNSGAVKLSYMPFSSAIVSALILSLMSICPSTHIRDTTAVRNFLQSLLALPCQFGNAPNALMEACLSEQMLC